VLRALSIATVVVVLTLAEGASASAPLILPHPAYRAGHRAGLQVAAPHDAKSCRLTIKTGHRVVARHRVSLGGPTRIITWRVGRSARGSWGAVLFCSGGSWTATRRSTLIVKKPGRPRGRLVKAGTIRVVHGTIPEMPSGSALRFANPLSNDDVVINRCGDGVVGCFNACGNSEQINSTRTTGDGGGTAVQVEPTGTARANAVANLASMGDWFSSSLDENYVLYRTMWSDLNRCANLPHNLSGTQRHSLYEQMACHALYGVASRFGGNTWDFEAWREDVDWTEALSYEGRCGQRYGDVGDAAAYLQGTLAKAFDTHASTLGPEAWLVSNLDGLNVRRNVATARGYNCLTASGKAAAKWYPSSFLDEYLGARGPDVSDDEACGPGGGAPPPPPPPPPPGPPPPPPAFFTHHVYGTCRDGACGLRVRTGPGYSGYPFTHVIYDGDQVDIVCQAVGEAVSNGHATSAIWDRQTDGTWVTDFYVDTDNIGTWSPPIPQC
jgi:hypothetical protein